MNKRHLPKNLYTWVRLRPSALLIDAEGCAIPSHDRPWMVMGVTDTHVQLQSEGSGHIFNLGLDHVRDYRTDFTTDASGRRGFLMVQGWVIVTPTDVIVEPMHPVLVGAKALVFPARFQLACARTKQREERLKAAAQSKAFGDLLVGAGKVWLVGAALSALTQQPKNSR